VGEDAEYYMNQQKYEARFKQACEYCNPVALAWAWCITCHRWE